MTRTKEVQTVREVRKLPFCRGIKDRGITKETCEYFGIREELDESTALPIAHYFPVTYRGKLTGYIKRLLDVPKKKAWSVVGAVTSECDFLGQHKAKQDGTKTLLVVEGFYDVLAAWQMLQAETPEKYKDYINVVSLTLGAGNAVEDCLAKKEFISKHQKFVTCFDSDEMTEEEKQKTPWAIKGVEATQQVGLRFKGSFYIPLSLKDPCEYLKAGRSKDFYKLVAFDQREITYAHITKGIGLTAEEIMEEPEEGLDLATFPKLSKILGKLRPNELTIIMSIPKGGKTYLARAIAYELRKRYDEVVCYCSLEDNKRQVADSFVAYDNAVRIDKYMFDKSLIPKEKVQKTLDTILTPEKFFLIDTEDGAIRLKEVEDLLESAVDMGAKWIIFDHFSYLTDAEGNDTGGTKKAIDSLLTKVKNLTKNHPIHVLGINHVTVDPNRGIVLDENRQVQYPYWYRVNRYDGAGSKGFAKIADNIILIDVQFIDDEMAGKRQAKVALNRRGVTTGRADLFELGPNGRIKRFEE